MKYPILTGSGTFDSGILGFKKNTFSSKRLIETYEIELYTDADTYGICNDQTVPYEPGVLAVYRPGDIRYSRLNFRCKYLHIIIEDKELAAAVSALPPYIVTRNTEKLNTLFDKIDSLFPVKDEDAAMRLTAYLLSLVADIRSEMSMMNSETVTGKNSDSVSTAKAYINEYYMNQLTLDDIAKTVHLTPNHFCTLFASVCGVSPHAYLTSVRIDRAKYLLRTTTMSITEIATSVGASSYNYFSYLFKRESGMSPSEYRNEMRKNTYVL